ncbi:MAG: hypothetical protein ACR2O3_09725 [Rhizobiaceae bacterium]
MNAQRKRQAGDVIYQVDWCPAKDAEKLRSEDPEAWPAEHCTRTATFDDFCTAEKFACEAVKSDWYGSCSLSQEMCENPKYGWWENQANWSVEKGMNPGDLDPAKPDYR